MRSSAVRVPGTSAMVAVAALAAFLVMAVVVAWPGAVAFDAPLIAWVSGLGVPADAWRALTLGGDTMTLAPLGTVLVLWLLWRRRPVDAALVIAALILAAVTTEAIKELLARPRPPGLGLATASGFSFPSGHTANSTTAYGLVLLFALRRSLPRTARWPAVAAACLVPALVGISRVALGVHYPSDVIGGWCFGIAVAATAAAVSVMLSGRMERRVHSRT